MKKIGIIAGWGKLPSIWCQEAKKNGYEVYAFPLNEEETISLDNFADKVIPANIGEFDRLINTIKEQGLEEIVMLGKVQPGHLTNLELDDRMKRMLAGLKSLNNDSVLLGIVQEIENARIKVLSQTTFMEIIVPGPGVLTSKEPDPVLLEDMKYGFKMSREIGRLDIGQTVIVKDRHVIAAESIEGTDATIRRGGELAGPGATMAKVAKPQQDMRFDLPAVGLGTLQNLIDIKAGALAIEADKTFLMEKETFLKRAEEAGITVVAFDAREID